MKNFQFKSEIKPRSINFKINPGGAIASQAYSVNKKILERNRYKDHSKNILYPVNSKSYMQCQNQFISRDKSKIINNHYLQKKNITNSKKYIHSVFNPSLDNNYLEDYKKNNIYLTTNKNAFDRKEMWERLNSLIQKSNFLEYNDHGSQGSIMRKNSHRMMHSYLNQNESNEEKMYSSNSINQYHNQEFESNAGQVLDGNSCQHLLRNDTKNINEIKKCNLLRRVISALKLSQIFINQLMDDTNVELHIVKDVKLSDHMISGTWQPTGFANPIGYCYLNCTVQILGSCIDFVNDFLSYKWNFVQTNKDSIFVEGLFNLITALRIRNESDIDKALKIVQLNITESSLGDDVYKCFMNILTRVNTVLNNHIDQRTDDGAIVDSSKSNLSKADLNYVRSQNKNPGFVFDNFYGQMCFEFSCKSCQGVCRESFQIMKSLALPVPKTMKSVTLEDCISFLLSDSDVEFDEQMDCECVRKAVNMKSVIKITHSPKYLFLYLNRGSYFTNGEKNETFVECGSKIKIETSSKQFVTYQLISVIDHIGNNYGGHYYCKCSYETNNWWLLNDISVNKLSNIDQIVTENTIVFLFKRH